MDSGPPARGTLASAPGPRPLPARLSVARKRRRAAGAAPAARAAAAAHAAAPADPLDAALAAAAPSDTHVALMALRAEWPGESVPELGGTPPVILVAQIYALVADRAAVDREVDAMRAANVVRYVKLAAAGGGDYAVVLTDDLRRAAGAPAGRGGGGGAAGAAPPLDAFFDALLPACTQVSVSQAQLDMVLGGGGGGGRSADHATALVRGGLLTLKGEGEYFFAVPRAGPFLRMRRKGNTELLGILRRAPYKEMLLARLELRRLRSSSFPALFHIRDVIGSGAAESVATSLGLLVRVVRGAGEPAHAY